MKKVNNSIPKENLYPQLLFESAKNRIKSKSYKRLIKYSFCLSAVKRALETKSIPSTQFIFIMYYVYLIRNNKDKTIYIGYTDNLERRIKEHKSKNPEIIYFEAYKDEIDARERERKLKQRGQSIRFLKERIKRSIKI